MLFRSTYKDPKKIPGANEFRFPFIVEYLYDDPNEPRVKEMGGDATEEEWREWWYENKTKPLKDKKKYVKNLIYALESEIK